jgi:Flp pilus assembly protein TadG
MIGRAGLRWRGQTILEFAISSLVVVALIFGMIDLGRAVFTRTMLTSAVREAARQAIITPNSRSSIVNAAAARSPSLTFTDSMFTITCVGSDNSARSCAPGQTSPPSVQPLDKVNVCVDYTFTMIATQIVGFSTIPFHECETAQIP